MSNLNKTKTKTEYDDTNPKRLSIANMISTFTNPPILCAPLFLIICIVISSSGTFLTSSFRFDWINFILCELIALIFTSILPMAIILHWAKKKNTDKDISNREDRFVPLIVGTVSYFIGFLFSLALNLPKFLTVLILCYTINTFIVMLITTKWKISIHTTGLSGPVSALIMLLGPIGALFGLVYPILIWSRVTLKKHTMAQAIMGGFLGFILTVGETHLFMALFNIPTYNLISVGDSFWFIFALVSAPIILALLGLLNKLRIEPLFTRKAFHFLAFLGFAIFVFYAPVSATVILVLSGVVSVLISYYAGETFIWHRTLDIKNNAQTNVISLASALIWIALALAFFTEESTVLASLCIAIAGAIAEPITCRFSINRFSLHTFRGEKRYHSLEASIAILIAVLLILILFTQNLFIAILVGIVICIIEILVPREFINLAIPLIAAIILSLMLH